MAYKFSNVKIADIEASVGRVYSQFPDMVDEHLLSAIWIIEEKGMGYWNNFYAELTGDEPTDTPVNGVSETQKNFEKNLKKV